MASYEKKKSLEADGDEHKVFLVEYLRSRICFAMAILVRRHHEYAGGTRP